MNYKKIFEELFGVCADFAVEKGKRDGKAAQIGKYMTARQYTFEYGEQLTNELDMGLEALAQNSLERMTTVIDEGVQFLDEWATLDGAHIDENTMKLLGDINLKQAEFEQALEQFKYDFTMRRVLETYANGRDLVLPSWWHVDVEGVKAAFIKCCEQYKWLIHAWKDDSLFQHRQALLMSDEFREGETWLGSPQIAELENFEG